MISWHTTRSKTDFGSLSHTAQNSYFAGAGSQSGNSQSTAEQNSGTGFVSIVNSFIGSTLVNDFGTARTPVTRSETLYAESGFSTVSNYFSIKRSYEVGTTIGTSTTTTTTFSTNYESGSSSISISGVFVTTATGTITDFFSTTTTSTREVDVYTSTISGSRVTITEISEGQTFTTTGSDSRTLTHIVTTSTAFTFTEAYDVGTVVSAENEWFWSLTVTPELTITALIPQKVSEIAVSFTQATLWPLVTSNAISFVTYANSPSLTTFANAEDTEQEDYDITGLVFTETTIAYTGNIPLGVTTDIIFSSSATTSSFTRGIASNTFGALTTGGTTYTVPSVYVTSGLTVLPADQTVTMSASVKTTTLYTRAIPYPYSYQGSSSSSTTVNFFGTVFSNSFGMQQGSSEMVTVRLGYSSLSLGGDNTYFEPVPKMHGFRAPQNIAQSASIGSNLNVGGTIHYPFFSSVQNNVMSPVVYPFPTTAIAIDSDKTALTTFTFESDTYEDTVFTDVTRWRYSWSSFTLHWTSETTATSVSGTKTITVPGTSTGTGTIGVAGDNNDERWENGGNVFGGYPPYSATAEEGVYPPNAVYATTISTNGVSSEATASRSSYYSTSKLGSMQVEEVLPWFYTYGATGAPASLPIFATTRNGNF